MIGVVDERLHQTDTTRGARPRRLPPHGAARPRRSTASPASSRSTWSSTSRCRSRWSSSASPAAGSAWTAARSTRSRSRRSTRGTATTAAATSCQRDDDTEEAIRRRLDLYQRETAPLIEYYEKQSLLVEVDGLGATEEVSARLVAVIDAADRSADVPHQVDPGPHGRRAGRDAPGRPGGRGDARAHPRGDPAGRHRPATSTGSAGRCWTAAGATSNFLGYHGYPAVICASPNDVVVHGIPSDAIVLDDGDIVSIDCGAIVDGWHGDAAFTAPVGTVGAPGASR